MKQIIQSLPYPEYSTIERDSLTNIPYGYIIYNTDNNILEMFDYSDAWITWLSGGSQGIQGLQGYKGMPGRDGVDGSMGPRGMPGRDGVDGSQGIQGLQGYKGQDGTNGVDGSQGIQGLQGYKGQDGTNGVDGSQGIQGLQGYGGGLISILYDDLISAINNSELKPGSQYLITDFRTVHHILDNSTSRTGDINTGELEPLIVKAVSVNELDKEAISTVYPKDIIYYNITSDIRDIAFYNDGGTPVAGYKGQIYFRHDTIQNVSAWYDFRNVKFRRWLVEATGWVSGSSYTAKDVVEYNNILYKCKVTHSGVSTAPNSDSTNWIKWLDKTVNWSWTSNKTKFNIGNITTNNLTMSNPVDLFTFGDYYEHVKDISIGRNDLSLLIGTYGIATILNNIVFNTTDNIITCLTNTFDKMCLNNTIGNNFTSNTIGNNFTSNTIGNNFKSNTIGDNFKSNTIGYGFGNNTIGYGFGNNTIGNSFYSNTIGDDFGNNTIGNSFIVNTIGNNFNNNSIGYGFGNNTIGNNFTSNTIGNNFTSNTIGDNFKSNTIGNAFRVNTITSGIYNIDFTQATHVYGNYNCEIFKRLDGTVRLRYTDNNDTILTVAPDA